MFSSRSSSCECSCVIPETSCRSSSALAPRNMAGFLAMQPCERLAQIPQESSVPLLCRAARSAPAVQCFLQGHLPVNAAASSLTVQKQVAGPLLHCHQVEVDGAEEHGGLPGSVSDWPGSPSVLGRTICSRWLATSPGDHKEAAIIQLFLFFFLSCVKK
ncbi:uncharacterized protein LOC144037701 isoform X2 [Vanacampus margaritifer]